MKTHNTERQQAISCKEEEQERTTWGESEIFCFFFWYFRCCLLFLFLSLVRIAHGIVSVRVWIYSKELSICRGSRMRRSSCSWTKVRGGIRKTKNQQEEEEWTSIDVFLIVFFFLFFLSLPFRCCISILFFFLFFSSSCVCVRWFISQEDRAHRHRHLFSHLHWRYRLRRGVEVHPRWVFLTEPQRVQNDLRTCHWRD